MITLMAIKITEINRAGEYIAASGFNSNLNKMNVTITAYLFPTFILRYCSSIVAAIILPFPVALLETNGCPPPILTL